MKGSTAIAANGGVQYVLRKSLATTTRVLCSAVVRVPLYVATMACASTAPNSGTGRSVQCVEKALRLSRSRFGSCGLTATAASCRIQRGRTLARRRRLVRLSASSTHRGDGARSRNDLYVLPAPHFCCPAAFSQTPAGGTRQICGGAGSCWTALAQ